MEAFLRMEYQLSIAERITPTTLPRILAEITDVLVDGVSPGSYCIIHFHGLSASHTISVTFNQITYTITASAGPNGSISPNGANTVLCGNDQTFAITPIPCYAIDDVLVDGVSQGAITSYTFTNTPLRIRSARHSFSEL